MGVLDAIGDAVDAVNPIDEIVDFGTNVAEGDALGALGNVLDAATPVDEIYSGTKNLFFDEPARSYQGPRVAPATPTPLPGTPGKSVLPEPSPQPPASSFTSGSEKGVEVDTNTLYEDAGKFEAGSESYASIESAAEGLTIPAEAFSFIGGQASAAYNNFQATMVAILGTAPEAHTGFADSLRLTAKAYDDQEQREKTNQTKDVGSDAGNNPGGSTGGGGTGGGTGGGGTGGGGGAQLDPPKVDGSTDGETIDDKERAELDAKADRLDARADALDRQADQADEHADRAQQQVEALDAEIEALEAQAAELDKSATETEYRATELDLKAEQQTAAGDQAGALQTRTEAAALRADAAAQRAEAADIREQIAKLEDSRDAAVEEMTDAREDAAELRDKAAELRDKAAELHHEAGGQDHGAQVELETDVKVDGSTDGGAGEGTTEPTGSEPAGSGESSTGETGTGESADAGESTSGDAQENPASETAAGDDAKTTPHLDGEGDARPYIASLAEPQLPQPVAAQSWTTRLNS